MNKSLTVSQEDRNTILNLFPGIEKIKEPNLREKVIRTWVRIWRESPYKSLIGAPNMPSELGPEDEDIVSHTNSVVRAAESIASQIAEEYGISINFDYLLAGAFLHDADKPVTYERKGKEIVLSDLGKKVGHGVYGACVALEEGLPVDVAHIIIAHTKTTNIKPATVEAIIINHCDLVKALSLNMARGGTLYLKV